MSHIRLFRRLFSGCCLVMIFGFSRAQTRNISGKITDPNGSPLIGASIAISGTKGGTFSAEGGKFNLEVPVSADQLVISYIGYQTLHVSIAGITNLQITLQPVKTNLNELVVVGYGTQKRRDLTGSISSVKGSDIKDLPVTNIGEALQGRAAGVEVIKNSGEPGAAPTIIIRGVSSLNQPQPLYIVDGVRQSGDNINPQDIASINILKDASAASIYGSAAAGGVIIITTKKGSGTPVIRFNARYGITHPELIPLLGKTGYIKLENIINPSRFAGATQLDTLANTDWVHALYGNATEQNYELSISGSTPVVSYLLSGFYNAQKGIYINNLSNLAGVRINTDYTLGKNIKIGEQVYVTQRKTLPPVGSEAQLHNPPFRTLPIIPIYKKDGSWGVAPPGYNIQFGGPNPVGAALSANAQNFQNNLQGNIYADIKLPLHLSFRTTLGYTYNEENEDFYQGPFDFGTVVNTINSLNKYYIENTQVLSNFVLTYDQHFGRHHINAIAGYEQIISKYNNINVTESYVGLPGYSFIQTSNTTFNVNGTNDPNGLVKSEFGRLNYNYNDLYYLSLSARQDANFTVFGPNKQKGVFPAGSVGWNIGDEPFFKSAVPVINALKLRGSYGTLGNSNITPYSFLANYSQFSSFYQGSAGGQNFAPGAPLVIANTINSIPNPNLHWETVYETNVGLDGEAFKGRLYFTVDWYNKTTKNMLYYLPLPPSSGITNAYLTNIGSVNNRGVDIELGYRGQAGKLGYDVSVNAGFNKNKVLNLSGITNDALYDGNNFYNNGDAAFSIMSNQNITITKAGLPFGSFYGYKVLGIFKTDAQAAASAQPNAHAGDLIFAHDPKNGKTLSPADRQVIGNPNPKLVYGATIQLTWKRFDVAMLFNGVAGVQLFNGVKAYEMYPFSDGNTTSKVFGDSYLGSNQLTSQPRLGVVNSDGSFTLDPNGNYTTVNSYFIENGNYLKLKNLQIGYTFSNKWLKRVKIRTARLFIMTNNLFTITKYTGIDPEIAGAFSQAGYNGITTRGIDAVSQYPQTKIYSAGLDLTF
ncbi:MAG TPA: TonB-dependent receptor [Chitinophagaceae bacterium]|nr:TonB-dependent receptor [Chitinophagaceae bacterium]